MSLCNNGTTQHLENILPQLSTKNTQYSEHLNKFCALSYRLLILYDIWNMKGTLEIFFSRDFPSFNKSRINRKIVWYLRTNVLGCINGLAVETTQYTRKRIMGITLCALAYLVCQVNDFVTDLNLCVSHMTWILCIEWTSTKHFFHVFVNLIRQTLIIMA